MEFQIDVKNPIVLGLAAVVLLGGGGWYAWNNPEAFKQMVRSNYDRDAVIRVEGMREALDENLMLFLRSELIRAATEKGTMGEQIEPIQNDLHILEVTARPRYHVGNQMDFYRAREDRQVDIRLKYRVGELRGEASAEAELSRANRWTLYSVSLEP